MRLFSRLSIVAFLVTALSSGVALADATAKGSAAVTIKADVQASGKAHAATGDALFAKGELEAALVAYGEGFAATRDATFVYAMAQCHKGLGHADEAKAMFEMYLGAGAEASAKYKAEAEAELGIAAEGAVETTKKVVGKVKKATKQVAFKVAAGVYTAADVSIKVKVKAKAKAEAEAGDAAYKAGNYKDAAQSYLAAYAKTQQAIALYAAGQAHAQAGNAAEARAVLLGYLATKPKGEAAKQAKAVLLSVGGSAKSAVKVSVKAKVTAKAKARAGKGDTSFKAGKYLAAAKLYAEAYAQTSEAALLYAQGMAQYYAGMTADAAATLKAYLAASGELHFKAQAEATLRATGGAAAS